MCVGEWRINIQYEHQPADKRLRIRWSNLEAVTTQERERPRDKMGHAGAAQHDALVVGNQDRRGTGE